MARRLTLVCSMGHRLIFVANRHRKLGYSPEPPFCLTCLQPYRLEKIEFVEDLKEMSEGTSAIENDDLPSMLETGKG